MGTSFNVKTYNFMEGDNEMKIYYKLAALAPLQEEIVRMTTFLNIKDSEDNKVKQEEKKTHVSLNTCLFII